jgi:hypothetical protein
MDAVEDEAELWVAPAETEAGEDGAASWEPQPSAPTGNTVRMRETTRVTMASLDTGVPLRFVM